MLSIVSGYQKWLVQNQRILLDQHSTSDAKVTLLEKRYVSRLADGSTMAYKILTASVILGVVTTGLLLMGTRRKGPVENTTDLASHPQ